MTRRQRKRLLITGLILLNASCILTALLLSGRLGQPQRLITDGLFFQTREQAPEFSQFVVLVAIDDKSIVSLKSYGRVFGWPRSLYAEVVKQLTEARARTIVFDVLFDVPGDGDEELAAAIDDAVGRATFVIQPAAGDPLGRVQRGPDRWIAYSSAFEPLPALEEVGSGLGLVDQEPDSDGTIRRMPMVYELRGEPFPSLPLLAVSRFLRRPQPWDGPIENGKIPLAGREISIDQRGMMTINYAGGPYDAYTDSPPPFTVVSFVDVLNGRVPPDTFRSKLVLIGVTATGFADDYWVPTSVDSKMDGVEIHANAIDTILRGEYLREVPQWLTITLIFSFALIAGATLMTLPMLVAALFSLLVLAAYVFAASYYFDEGIVLNLVYPPLSLFLTYVAVVCYRVIFEQGQSRALRGVLGQYLSPSVVAHITRDPDSLKLGGDQREMTVMFSDIRGFTSVSEQLDPEALVLLLNEYLTAMSDVIFKYDGTIDKYMGDAIMAFWGAPEQQPNHATLACRAAVEMVAALGQLNTKWADEGRPPLNIGIGLNTGQMKVGNMGSNSRFDYTVMGDAVNLGSRLEGLNKEYGTTLLISKSTLEQTGSQFHERFVDLVAVKGKKEPVEVFEILDLERLPGIHGGPGLAAYNEGLELYRQRDWLGAAAKFQEALRYAPDDGPAAVYLHRCEDLMRDPPPADWDGVYVMTRK